MGTLSEDLNQIKSVEDTLTSNKVAQFAYTQTAYNNNDATGVEVYNVNNEQNIPSSDMAVLKVNETILTKGWRAQASSITRMLMNHFLGRLSYNLNKVNDNMSSLLTTLISHRGTADGFATLDENGRIPYSQLPESAMEYKGNWNAETNTPTLADGTGDKGDFYIVQVAGTQNLGSGDIQFFVNDRVIYGQNNTWERLSAGSVHKVNNISPTDGNVTITGEDIKLSSEEETTIKASIDTAEGRLDTAEGRLDTAEGRLDTAEGRLDTAESNIGTMDNLQTTDKSSLVSAINEVNDKEITLSGQISPRFTYVVDSDQKLLDWANNVSGNDYSAVLIRRGTWTSTKGVNLTTSGTKVVVGDAGSKLVFNQVEKCLYYDTIPTGADYFIRDVSVECSNSGKDGINLNIFKSCTNLTNCTATSTNTATDGASSTLNSLFDSCTNLINCTGSCQDSAKSACSTSIFSNCTNLINCTGTGTVIALGNASMFSFYSCNNLTNCTGNCTSNGTSPVLGMGKSYAFDACTNIINCTGTAVGTGKEGSYSVGYGFSSCKRVSGCKKGSTCTTSVFNASYASFSSTSTYACADTPNGGFNDTTN